MKAVRRATVQLGLACDNQCVFCGQVGLEREAKSREAIEQELTLARADAHEVTFMGGEPALRPDLAALVGVARSLGFQRIGVQSNGRQLGLESLAAAGLTDIHLSIHGGTPPAHDYHTGVDGSFAAAFAALSAARAKNLTVVVNTVLTRSNARGLGDLARLLAARSASAWCISVPRVRGRAAEIFDRVVPRLGVAMPFALHAVQTAESLRLPTFLRGAPACVLGPFAKNMIADAPRAYGAACEGCPSRDRCPGVEPEYLERFAGDELSKRAELPRSIDSELARLFVGEGAVAPSRVASIAEPPAKARVALPMAGKVRPAHAEVPRAAEKKTGAALRELFKGLYDEEPRE